VTVNEHDELLDVYTEQADHGHDDNKNRTNHMVEKTRMIHSSSRERERVD
jgi:hypothetical protein